MSTTSAATRRQPHALRSADPGSEHEAPHEQDPLGGTAVDPQTAALLRSPGPGEALPALLRRDMGQALGADLSEVRVHTGPQAHRANQAVAARAFTSGSDILFSQGSYQPETEPGQRLLAHELSHVVQGQRAPGSASGAGPTIGRADDPAEAQADRSADRVMTALRRQALLGQAGPVATTAKGGGDVQRTTIRRNGDGSGSTAVVDPTTATGGVTAGAATTFGQDVGIALFTKAVGEGGAPKDDKQAASRLKQLRTFLDKASQPQREAITADRALLDKARIFVGTKLYASLLGALRVYTKPPAGSAPHLTGAEADTIIQARMGAIAHLKTYLKAAVKAGKKGEGYVAVLGDEDWATVYGAQDGVPVSKKEKKEEKNTNAFIANRQTDRPAMVNASRGTRSTAVHESMHRYSRLDVLNKWGFRLNEGMTEYFTRLITDRNGDDPAQGGPSRNNYDENHMFVTAMLAILGSGRATQEKALAEIYFRGKTAVLKSHFEKAHQAAKTSKKDIATKWQEFEQAISAGNWSDAKDAMP
jgi:Domain of unknown function (DUF4157)